MYLTPADYEFQIREDVLSAINDGSTTRFPKAESAAARWMISHLNKCKYDIAKIFLSVKEFQEAAQYAIGSLVYWKTAEEDDVQAYKVYKALQASANVAPSNGEVWELDTSRDPLIIMYLADIAVYNFFSADANGMMPEVVRERYKDAKEWVIGVGKGDIITDLPTLQETDDQPYEGNIRYGSQPLENNIW